MTDRPGLSLLWWLAALLALLAVPAFVRHDGVLFFTTYVLIWAIFALGYDLAFGLSGLLSIGHAAFFGIGGYSTAILTMRHGVAFEPALLLAALIAALAASLFGIVALRLSGIFFALTTLALGQLAMIASDTVLAGLTKGQDGIAGVPRPALFGLDFGRADFFLVYVTVVFFATLALVALIRNSPFGQVMVAIRTNELRASQLGFNVKYFKISVLVVSGFFSGLAGGLLASQIFFVNSGILHWTLSGDIVIMTLMGGAGTLFGPILGAIAFEGLKESLSQLTDHWRGIMGVVFVLFVIFLPDGLTGLIRRAWQRVSRPRP
jgi:branched-chain amino acid transport system permease protein